jgi:hypothetical protein
MTPIKPEDKPKMIVLAVGVLIVAAFGFIQISAALKPPTPAPQKEVVIGSNPEPSTTLNTGGLPEVPETPSFKPILIADVPSAPQVDPFRRVLSDNQGRAPERSERPAPMSGPVPQLPNPTMATVKIEPYTPGEDGNAGSDDLQLRGVLAGSDPVAVFSKGDKDIVVRPGENITAEAVLVEVTPLGAVIRANKKRVAMEIGQAVAATPAVQAVPAGPGGNAPLLLNGIG